MKEPSNYKIPINIKYGISIFFSILILSYALSFVEMIQKEYYTNYKIVEGTIFCYTLDSIYVGVDWEVEYNSTNVNEKEMIDIESTINISMDKKIKETISEMNFNKCILLTKSGYEINKNNIRIKVFLKN